MNKRLCIQILQWPIAIVIGFLIINILCFLYERPVGWLDTPNGPSVAVRKPGSIMVHGQEGYAITRLDENGYANPQGELADEYILICGASHTLAKEVAPNKKYAAIVNYYLSDDGLIHAYNIGGDAHFLTSQIQHFKAAMDAYPNASLVTIEIGSTDFDIDIITEYVNQMEYDSTVTAASFNGQSQIQKGKTLVKEFLPLFPLIKNQINTWKKKEQNQGAIAGEYSFSLSDYESVTDAVLKKMASQCNGKLVFVYHPRMELSPKGEMCLFYDDSFDSFQELCEKYNIGLLDVGPRFKKMYKDENKLPYGFFNTVMGGGHLNKNGHQIMADAIIEYWEETKK